jgi:hypothetical protein
MMVRRDAVQKTAVRHTTTVAPEIVQSTLRAGAATPGHVVVTVILTA